MEVLFIKLTLARLRWKWAGKVSTCSRSCERLTQGPGEQEQAVASPSAQRRRLQLLSYLPYRTTVVMHAASTLFVCRGRAWRAFAVVLVP